MSLSKPTVRCQLHYKDNYPEREPFLEDNTTTIHQTINKRNDEWVKRDRLLIIVIIQICIVFLWIIHESIRFDHSCSSQLSSSIPNTYPPTMESGNLNRISRSLLEETSKEPEIITLPNGTLVKVISRKRKLLVFRKPEDIIVNSNKTNHNWRGKLVGRKKIRLRVTTPNPNVMRNNNITKNINSGIKKRRPIQRRYHLLSGANNNNRNNNNDIKKNHYPSIKKESTSNIKVNKWLHGVVNPNDPDFTNKGEIRAVKVKAAKKKPKINIEKIVLENSEKYNDNKDLDNNFEKEIKEKFIEDKEVIKGNTINKNDKKNVLNKKTFLDIPFGPLFYSNNNEINKNIEEIKDGIVDEDNKSNEVIIEKEHDIKSVSITKEIKESEEEEEEDNQRFEEVPQSSHSSENSQQKIPLFESKDYYINEKEVYDAFKTPTTTETLKIIEKDSKTNFTTELSRFSSNTSCILRTLLAFWCLAQLSTLIFFLIGIFLNFSSLRCLFIPHIIIEGLFTIIGSIYCITITLFSIVLYFLVTGDEMNFEKLLKWLTLSFIILILILIHGWILDKKIKYFKNYDYTKENIIKIIDNNSFYNTTTNDQIEEEIEEKKNILTNGNNNVAVAKLYSHSDYGVRFDNNNRIANI
uniref:Uncharacterized protein n=1 Tax=Parastrongyloides trichosuri TaxID=131310 RepID=A0A0N4ZPP3_PARTI